MAEKAKEEIGEENMNKIASLSERSGLLTDEVLQGCKIGEYDVPGVQQIADDEGVSIEDAIKLWTMRNSWRFTEKVNAMCIGTFIPNDENGEPRQYESYDGSVVPIRICNFLVNTEGGLIVGSTDWGCKTDIEAGKCYELHCREGKMYEGVRQVNIARDGEGNYKYKEIEPIKFGKLNAIPLSDLVEYDRKYVVVREMADFGSVGETEDKRKVFRMSDGETQVSVFAEPSLIEGVKTGNITLCGRVGVGLDGGVTINAGAIVNKGVDYQIMKGS